MIRFVTDRKLALVATYLNRFFDKVKHSFRHLKKKSFLHKQLTMICLSINSQYVIRTWRASYYYTTIFPPFRVNASNSNNPAKPLLFFISNHNIIPPPPQKKVSLKIIILPVCFARHYKIPIIVLRYRTNLLKFSYCIFSCIFI